jgi:ribokinase
MKSILVIGSSNTDMVIRVPELPLPGQTVMGDNFQTFAGGKGANQAVAAQRAGGDVKFLASVGNDELGRSAIDIYRSEGIDTSLIQIVDDRPSGVAMIFVNDAGENCISVAPGANKALTSDIVRRHESAISKASVLLLQLESPIEAVVEALRIGSQNETRCVLNPAPAAKIPEEMLDRLYCITPNESEAEMLTGVSVVDEQSAAAAAEKLLRRGVENVVVTMGENGALLCNSGGTHYQEAPSVAAVDTTAAGDTFNGVLVTLIAEGQPIKKALRLAVEAASLSVQTAGAITSIPLRKAFDVTRIRPADQSNQQQTVK